MNVRTILQILLCCLFPAMVVFGQADQVERNPVGVSVKYVDGIVTMNIKNYSSKPVELSQLNGKLIWIRLEVWALGEGVELYSAHDATWRRADAFVGVQGFELKAGAEITHRIILSEALPAIQRLDKSAKRIKTTLTSVKTGRIAAVVSYSTSDSQGTCEARGEVVIEGPLVPVPKKVEQVVPPNGP